MKNKTEKIFTISMWLLIAVMLISALITNFIGQALKPFAVILSAGMFVAAFWHGSKLYGWGKMLIFFLLSWVVSNFFETLSIAVGFPFGNYHYAEWLVPQLFNVPLFIMPTYFAMGYFSWTIAHILIGQGSTKLKGASVFLVPFVASFIMVMWDLIMDPLNATLDKMWIWEDGGSYFGVPISNYFGWFLVVYIFLQIFAVIISKTQHEPTPIAAKKSFWLIPVVIYGIRCLWFVLLAATKESNIEYYRSMGLICVFTMGFVTVLSLVKILKK